MCAVQCWTSVSAATVSISLSFTVTVSFRLGKNTEVQSVAKRYTASTDLHPCLVMLAVKLPVTNSVNNCL